MAMGYETTLKIDSFGGFFQGAGNYGTAMKYAVDGKNFDTTGGLLRSMDGGRVHLDPKIPAPIGTLMLLYRRFNVDRGLYPHSPPLLVAAAGSKIYAGDLLGPHMFPWMEIYDGITNDHFDYVTYETSTYWTLNGKRVAPNTPNAIEVTATDPIDVLIMTNADDGMFIVYGDALDIVPFKVQPSTTDVEKKFGVLTRHAERIWGAAIPDQPDMLMYSTPFEPLNWEQNNDYPEDGAGDIQQPSWDGDSFVALRTYGSYLLAIKKNRIWRVTGTNPGEYYFKEQFGGGTIVEDTVVVYNDYVYLLSYDGLMVYDGTAVQPFRQDYIKGIMKRVNWEYAKNAVAAMRGDVYCLAVPLDGSTINNAVIEYNANDRTFNLRYGVYASSFLVFEDTLYYTESRDGHGGVVMKLDGAGDVLPMSYVTAYQDLDHKSVTKSGFEVYISANRDIEVTLGIRTEKKLKQRTVSLVAGVPKRVRLNVSGRFFRLEMEVPRAGGPWAIDGAIQLNMELDED